MSSRLLLLLPILLALLGCRSVEKDLGALGEQDPAERQEAAASILESLQEKDPVYAGRISEISRKSAELLQDRSPLVRASAVPLYAEAIAMQSESPADKEFAMPVLYPLLLDPNVFVRMETVKACAKLQGSNTPTHLARILQKDENAWVRAAAARALGELRAVGAVDELIQALDDLDGSVRYLAHEALTVITGRDPGIRPEAWRALQAPAGEREGKVRRDG